ncbi:MAG: helix-turn-helix domain-containing protein [Opitutaceae bacterium]
MQELAAQKAKIEEAMIAERKAQLANIHEEYGYGSREDLIAALRGSGQSAPARKTAGKRGRKKRAVAAAAPKPAASRGRKRRKRTTITPELRKSIESAVRSGKTGAAVAAEFGVSLPTVQNIKRAAGLTRK